MRRVTCVGDARRRPVIGSRGIGPGAWPA